MSSLAVLYGMFVRDAQVRRGTEGACQSHTGRRVSRTCLGSQGICLEFGQAYVAASGAVVQQPKSRFIPTEGLEDDRGTLPWVGFAVSGVAEASRCLERAWGAVVGFRRAREPVFGRLHAAAT